MTNKMTSGQSTRQGVAASPRKFAMFFVSWMIAATSVSSMSLEPMRQNLLTSTALGRSVYVGWNKSFKPFSSMMTSRHVMTQSKQSHRGVATRLGQLLLSAAADSNGDHLNNNSGGGGGGGVGVTRRTILSIVSASLLALPVVTEIYSRIGKTTFPDGNFPTPTVGTWKDVQHVTLVFHGAGGQDVYTDQLMTKLDDLYGTNKAHYSSMMEWSEFSTNILQASFNGQRIGREAARRLQQQAPNLQTVHLIGISVGSFAANAACLQLKNKDGSSSTSSSSSSPHPSTPYIQTTFLAPFTQRGILGIGYGIREFGKSADYAQQYLNTDDPVPSTHSPLNNAVCFDITSIRPTETFGHDWPVQFYTRTSPFSLGIVPKDQQRPRGIIIPVTQE